MAENQTSDTNKTGKKGLKRSPLFPFITYTDAISRAKLIKKHEGRNSTTAQVLYNHLGYQKKTGSSGRVLAALKHYGLLEEKGGQFKLTDKFWRYVHLPDESTEKHQLEKEFAMRPRIFREIVAQYPEGLPSDATLKSYLILEKDFNENSTDHFIKVLKSALDIAKPFSNGYNIQDETFDDSEDDFEETEQMDGNINSNKANAPTRTFTPQPPADGTRVVIDIPSDGEVKISFSGDVNMKTFQFVNGILKLQSEVFPDKSATLEENSEDNG